MTTNELTLIHMPGLVLPVEEVRSTGLLLVELDYDSFEEFDRDFFEASSRSIKKKHRKNCFLKFDYSNKRDHTEKLAALLHLALVLDSAQASCPPPPRTSIAYYRVRNVDPLKLLLDSMGIELPLHFDDRKIEELKGMAAEAVAVHSIERSVGRYGRNLLITELNSTYSPTLNALQCCLERVQEWVRDGVDALCPEFLPLEPLFMWQKEDPIHRVIRLASIVVYIEGEMLESPVKGVAPALTKKIMERTSNFDEGELLRKIRELYAIRSDFIHGRRMPEEWAEKDNELLTFGAKLTRRIVESRLSGLELQS